MTIKRITLKNFQKHKKRTIVLDPHITTLVGPSDVGKTAFIRAVRWVVFNRPSGNRFIRRGSKRASVIITTDKAKVVRKKGKQNAYVVNGKLLTAMKSKVPGLVTKKLKLGPSNFQNQLDGPFWFALSPGQAAKALNDLADLSVLDRLQDAANAILRDARATENVTREQLREAKEKVKDLKWARQCHKDWKALEAMKAELAGMEDNYDELATDIQRMKTVRRRSKLDAELPKDFANLVLIREAGDKAAEDWRDLKMMIENMEDYKNQIADAEAEAERLGKDPLLKGRCPTCLQRLPKNRSRSPSATFTSQTRLQRHAEKQTGSTPF
jgi:exonuclease SbcC